MEGTLVSDRKHFVIAILVVLAVTMNCFPASAKDEVIETIDSRGYINWSQWMIYVTELGQEAWQDRQEEDQSHIGDVTSFPFSSLFSAIKTVRIDASSRISDLIEQRTMVFNQLQGMIRQSEVAKREYLSNGAVELTLAFDMRGGFAQLALPGDIEPVPQIKTLQESANGEDGRGNGKIAGSGSAIAETYTGLILDARGMAAKPAMSARITSEDGEEVFGPTYVSREFAVQKGMVYYTTNLDSVRQSTRVGRSPLLVRALRTWGTNRCNFVVSNADAASILGNHMNLRFLKECNVAIVINRLANKNPKSVDLSPESGS
jgi:hypothetical protein